MYLPRTLEAIFKKASSQFPVVMVTGARQVGKTTFLRNLAGKNRMAVTLDDPRVLSQARSDPALFLQRCHLPILIDEIQYAPGLLPYIKMHVDNHRKPGQFWLTGSQPFHLMKGVSESLAGRVALLELGGLTRREILGKAHGGAPFFPNPDHVWKEGSPGPLTLRELYKIIWHGAFPAMALSPRRDKDLFCSAYVQTYLQRDIRDLAKVGDEMAFLRFLRIAASRTAQLLNLASMARDADIAPNTAKSWISILQASGLIHLLEPYHANVAKRLVKAPKLYFMDTGLCSYLTEWNSPEVLEAGNMSGPIFETWVFSEILKSWWHHGKQPPLYYYRDSDQKEIDLLTVSGGTLFPLEFKKSSNPGVDAVRHFQVLHKLGMKVGYGGVVCLADQSLPLTENAVIIPVGDI